MNTQPRLSVVVGFYNMRREAARTLRTLSASYQRGVAASDYEVIAVDNGSTEPLGEKLVAEIGGPHFRYRHVETRSPSPCAAINAAVREARADLVTVMIDGARMLSPGVLALSLMAARTAGNPFVYTLGMHIGPRPQNYSMLDGYNQAREDELLSKLDWQANGYLLFTVSSVALSSRKGFFSPLIESNCFTMRRDEFLRLGGFCEEFQLPGGGLANLDFFNTMNARLEVAPILLLGEATFHQFHGGVATNVPMQEHPWPDGAEEYRRVRGKAYAAARRTPLLFGHVPPECRALVQSATTEWKPAP